MINALDIFSGGGGSSYGARDAGAEIVCGIDMCNIASRTFQENFDSAIVIDRRLEEIRLNRLRDRIGDIDLLLASPECTNHTCAKGSAPKSEKSRATAMQVLRFARAFQPRWIVMENVIHMRPWPRFSELKERLEDLGYKLREQDLDSSLFGVPQKRKRLFLAADKKTEPGEVPIPRRRVRTVQSILDSPNTWKTTLLYRKRRAPDTLARAERALKELGPESSFLIVYYGTDGCGGWQSIDRPLRTVTTVDRFALVTPGEDGYQMRMLQVPELRRAMGFRDNFKLDHGTRRDRIRILGNGVCPPVMKAVVESLTSGA